MSPLGTLLWDMENDAIYFWSFNSGVYLGMLTSEDDAGNFTMIDWSPNENIFAVQTGNGFIQIWRVVLYKEG